MQSGILAWLNSFRYWLVSCALVTAACGGNSERPDAGPDAPPLTLVRLDLTPPNPRVPLGITQQLTATGVFTDATTKDLTSQVTWAADNRNVTISKLGVATAVVVGTAKITAALGPLSASITVTATDAQLQSIAVTPVQPTVPAGRTRPFTATGTFSDRTTRNLT